MIVIHHKGDAEKLFRGSSAIQNQCDATVTNAILAALPSQTKQEVADKIGRREDDPTFRAAWKGLVALSRARRDACASRAVA